MSEEGSAFPTRCDYCSGQFEAGIRYPTLTVEGDNGTLSILTFCDENCKGAWVDERER